MNIGALTMAMLRSGAAADGRGTVGSVSNYAFLEELESQLSADDAQETAAIETLTLEQRLKAKYPGIAYHVFDASSRYWKYRNDYPHHLLFQQDIDVSQLENWKPSGPNPDGLDPKVQRNLASIPPGSKAVIIHPKVQQRMEEDPAYADEIFARIEAWFAFDVARNEAIMPGCTVGMSQSVAIGEDGMIVNACSTSGGVSVSQSGSGSDDEEDFWTARARRHHEYMQWVIQQQILHGRSVTEMMAVLRRRGNGGSAESSHSVGASPLTASSHITAMAQVTGMMNSAEFRAALGERVGDVSIDQLFEITRQNISNPLPAMSF